MARSDVQRKRWRRFLGIGLLLLGLLLLILGAIILYDVLGRDRGGTAGGPGGSSTPDLIGSITGLVTAAGGLISAIAGLLVALTAARQAKR